MIPNPLLRTNGHQAARWRAKADRWGHIERRHVAFAAVGCVALGVVSLVDPSERALTPPCPLRAVTGLDCPLCGATRATHALVRGQLATALDFNALYVALLPVLIVAIGWWLVRGRSPAVLQASAVRWSMVVVAFAFMVLRNLPAFTVLAS